MRPFSFAAAVIITLAAPSVTPPALFGQGIDAPADDAAERWAWPFEITPFIGAYLPLTDLFEFTGTGIIPGTLVPAEVTLVGKQQSAFAFGARFAGWFNSKLGLEGTFSYASSELDVGRTIVAPGATVSDDRTVSANVWTATARVLYRLAQVDRSAAVLVGAGLAIISRGGSAYSAPAFDLPRTGAVSGTTDVGGVVDLGVRIDASSRVAIRLDAEAYLYSVSLSFQDPVFVRDVLTSDSKFQADLILSAGLAIGI